MKPHLRMVDVAHVPAIRRARWRQARLALRFTIEALLFGTLLLVIVMLAGVFQ